MVQGAIFIDRNPKLGYYIRHLGEIRSCVTQKLNDEMKLIVATDQWETEAFDWPGLSEDSDHSLFRFAADIRSQVNILHSPTRSNVT